MNIERAELLRKTPPEKETNIKLSTSAILGMDQKMGGLNSRDVSLPKLEKFESKVK